MLHSDVPIYGHLKMGTYVVSEVHEESTPVLHLPRSTGLFWSARSVPSDHGHFFETTTEVKDELASQMDTG